MVHEFTWILEMKLIAAPNSERTNLSPFTKGCREEGALLRISKFFRDNIPPIESAGAPASAASISFANPTAVLLYIVLYVIYGIASL